ncbi:hypothetical protein [Streptomyces sp. SYSU K217416]
MERPLRAPGTAMVPEARNLSAGSGSKLLEDRLEAVEGLLIDLLEEGALVTGELVRGSDVIEVPRLVLLLPRRS